MVLQDEPRTVSVRVFKPRVKNFWGAIRQRLVNFRRIRIARGLSVRTTSHGRLAGQQEIKPPK